MSKLSRRNEQYHFEAYLRYLIPQLTEEHGTLLLVVHSGHYSRGFDTWNLSSEREPGWAGVQ